MTHSVLACKSVLGAVHNRKPSPIWWQGRWRYIHKRNTWLKVSVVIFCAIQQVVCIFPPRNPFGNRIISRNPQNQHGYCTKTVDLYILCQISGNVLYFTYLMEYVCLLSTRTLKLGRMLKAVSCCVLHNWYLVYVVCLENVPSCRYTDRKWK